MAKSAPPAGPSSSSSPCTSSAVLHTINTPCIFHWSHYLLSWPCYSLKCGFCGCSPSLRHVGCHLVLHLSLLLSLRGIMSISGIDFASQQQDGWHFLSFGVSVDVCICLAVAHHRFCSINRLNQCKYLGDCSSDWPGCLSVTIMVDSYIRARRCA